jgi:hypothetical protein
MDTDPKPYTPRVLPADLPIRIDDTRYVVKNVADVLERYEEDRAFLLLIGCTRCKTSCVAGHNGAVGNLCACCTASNSIQTKHRPLLRMAALFDRLREGQYIVPHMGESELQSRAELYTEDDFKANQLRIEDLERTVDDPLAVRMKPAAHILPTAATENFGKEIPPAAAALKLASSF